MNLITVIGAGAFGTALAIALARDGKQTQLWARNAEKAKQMQAERGNISLLPNLRFPEDLVVTSDPASITSADILLLAVPTQKLRGFLEANTVLITSQTCVLCCKGVETGSGYLPTQVLSDILPSAKSAVLSGPGFAAEIAMGKPTALSLAGDRALQQQLSTRSMRLYLSDDPIGTQLGGALKNVIAIACGLAMGANLGESARASLMTRGYAEIQRLATKLGANPSTLVGLSGFGDLALTCTSPQSRNFSLGLNLGLGKPRQAGQTFEGVATARAVVELAKTHAIDMPISRMVAAVLDQELTVTQAMDALLSRPLKQEN